MLVSVGLLVLAPFRLRSSHSLHSGSCPVICFCNIISLKVYWTSTGCVVDRWYGHTTVSITLSISISHIWCVTKQYIQHSCWAVQRWILLHRPQEFAPIHVGSVYRHCCVTVTTTLDLPSWLSLLNAQSLSFSSYRDKYVSWVCQSKNNLTQALLSIWVWNGSCGSQGTNKLFIPAYTCSACWRWRLERRWMGRKAGDEWLQRWST